MSALKTSPVCEVKPTQLKGLSTDEEHGIVLKEIESLLSLNPPAGSYDRTRLENLINMAESYENQRWPVGLITAKPAGSCSNEQTEQEKHDNKQGASMTERTYQTIKLPSCADWTSLEYDETRLENMSVTFCPADLASARSALAQNPIFMAIEIGAAVDGDYDGKLNGSHIHVTSGTVTCVIDNEYTGTKWGYHITEEV